MLGNLLQFSTLFDVGLSRLDGYGMDGAGEMVRRQVYPIGGIAAIFFLFDIIVVILFVIDSINDASQRLIAQLEQCIYRPYSRTFVCW